MNTETRVRGVHSSRPGGYTHNDAHPAYATIKGFEVMRALRKGQAGIFVLQGGMRRNHPLWTVRRGSETC